MHVPDPDRGRVNAPVPPYGTLLVNPVLTTILMPPFAGTADASAYDLPLPPNPAFAGIVLGWQAFCCDPGAAGGVAHTAGLEWVLGGS